jgi:hypothetical protein
MVKAEIRINLLKLIDSKLTLEEYIILTLVWERNYSTLKEFANYHFLPLGGYLLYSATISNLEKQGWLKIVGKDMFTDLEIREAFIELFKPNDLERRLSEVASWITEYRDLFKGKKQGAMGDPNACVLKMKKLITQYPAWSKDQILKATENYVESQAPNYTYLQQADYFISKQGGNDKIATSRLLTYLEDLDTPVASTFSDTKEI